MFTDLHAVSNAVASLDQGVDRRRFLAMLGVAAGSVAVSSSAFGMPLAGLARSSVAGSILSWDSHGSGVHVMADRSTGGNSLIMISKLQTLLIDTKFAHLGGALFEDAKSFAGAQDEFDLTLINTHHHGDHTGGNGLIVPHCKSYAHKKAVKRIKESLETYKQSAINGPGQVSRSKGSPELLKLAMKAAELAEGWTRADVAPKNRVPDEGMTIPVGESTVSMHHFGRGHTDNDLVVRLEESNIVHTGDLVFAGLHPFFDPSARVSAIGWTKSLKGVLDLCDQDTIVVPGHGPVGDKKTVEAQLVYLEKLIEHVQAEIDADVPKDEAVVKSWDFMDGLGFESIRGRAIDAVYDELS